MSDKVKSKSKDKESSKEVKDKKDKEKKSDKEKIKEKKSTKDAKKDDEASKKNNKDSALDINNELINNLDEIEQKGMNKMNLGNYYDNLNLKNTNFNNRNMMRGMSNNMNIEGCDGCYEGEGVCFCIHCEKIFCKICEDQIHVVPSNRLHERVPIGDVYHLKKLCYHHKNPLKFYCESCEEPVCHECQMIGPHNNKLHRITNVFESFRKKFNYINNLVQKSLLNKSDQLTNQIHLIEMHIEEIKTIKNSIERDIRAEYSQLIEVLHGEEGKKLAILQYESALLQKESNRIQDIVNSVNDINMSESPDMIGFLLKYRQINESVELSLSKPFKKTIDVSVDDFSREHEERRAKLEKFEKMQKLLKAKDDIIWNLIQEKKAREEKEVLKLKEKTHNEISEWAKLSDKYALELKKYHLVCHFCGLYLEEANVNSLCQLNSADIDASEKGNYTTNNVPIDIVNTKRHFYGPPTREFENRLIEPTNKLNIEKKPTKSTVSSGFYKNPFENNILNESKIASYRSRSTSPPGNLRYSDESVREKIQNDWVWKVASVIQKNNINFYHILSEYDLDSDGFISPDDIRFAFVKLQINLGNKDIENMLKYFNIANMERISIKEFSKNFMSTLLNEEKHI